MTALAFFVGTQASGFVVLALFVVTLLAGLAVKFGLHRFTAGLLLNVWFVLAVGLPISYRADRIHTNGWHQALAWLIGSALWITLTGVVWLVSRRKWQSDADHRRPRGTGRTGSTDPTDRAVRPGAGAGPRRRPPPLPSGSMSPMRTGW